jgi:GxxExxY protein
MVDAPEALTSRVIGLAMEVHRALGPGLLESAYEECLCFELTSHGIPFGRQIPLPVIYKSVHLDCAYRMDLVIHNMLVVELKTIERILPVHEAQLLTYLRLSGITTGLILNFHMPVLKDGIKRLVLGRS